MNEKVGNRKTKVGVARRDGAYLSADERRAAGKAFRKA